MEGSRRHRKTKKKQHRPRHEDAPIEAGLRQGPITLPLSCVSYIKANPPVSLCSIGTNTETQHFTEYTKNRSSKKCLKTNAFAIVWRKAETMPFPAARDFKQNRVSLFSRLTRCPPRLTRNFKFGQVFGVETQLDAFEARMAAAGFFEAAVEDPFSAFSYNRGSVLTDFPTPMVAIWC